MAVLSGAALLASLAILFAASAGIALAFPI